MEFTEVAPMADGGGRSHAKGSGDDLLYTRARWRSGSCIRHDDDVVPAWGAAWHMYGDRAATCGGTDA
jgi:hypothetical protein